MSQSGGGTCLDVAHPSDDVIERRSVRDVVAQDEAVGATEEVRGEGAEPLLTGGVPQLQPHRSSLDLFLLRGGGDVCYHLFAKKDGR